MNKTCKFIYMIEFLMIIFGLGIGSAVKLVEYYINPPKVNNQFTVDLDNPLEEDLAYCFCGKQLFINTNGAICRLLDQPLMNNVVRLENGYLLTTFDHASDEVLHEYADATVRFKEYLDSRGARLVYVATPYTSSKYDAQLPAGIVDYGNDNTDRFIAMLDRAGIDNIDVREKMHDAGVDQYDMMYKTDHHWTTEAGLYVYGLLEEYIVNKTGCNVDNRVADIGNYSVQRYEKWHLGSGGQRTGIYYAGIDDFDLILPKFDTRISNGSSVGSMQDMMINMAPLENKDYTSRYTYDDVLDKTRGHFVNENSENDISILIITDSFGKAVIPFLTMGFYRIDYVLDENTAVITPELIEEYDPDIVVMLYYTKRLQEGEKGFAFKGF